MRHIPVEVALGDALRAACALQIFDVLESILG